MKATMFSMMTVAMLSPLAMAQSVTILPSNYYVSDFSYDGRYAAGNMAGPYETFRWSVQTGPVLLGRATLPTLGVAAGSPDISYAGDRVSASITNTAGTLMTQGLWDMYGEGWVALDSVNQPDARVVDGSISSAWGLSGDGTTISGFYWNNHVGATPSLWVPGQSIMPMDAIPGRSARLNAVNFDGTITVGWEESSTGPWQPRVWRDGVKIELDNSPAGSVVEEVSADGRYLVGNLFDDSIYISRVPALWEWDGAQYQPQMLGLLPGTPVANGFGIARGVSDDGSVVVGVNFYSFNPGGAADGIVWTQATGLMNAMDYFAMRGIDLSEAFDIRAMDAVSPDGSTFAATGIDIKSGEIRTVIIRLDSLCLVDFSRDGQLNFFDVSEFIRQYNEQGVDADLNQDGSHDFFDVSAFIQGYSMGCP